MNRDRRDLANYDLARDEQALAPFGEQGVGALPAEDFEDVRAHTPRGRRSGRLEPVSAPAVAPGDALPTSSGASSGAAATPSDEQRPGRGHAQAA